MFIKTASQGSGDATNIKSKTSAKKHMKFNEKKKSLSSNLTSSQKKKKVQHLWGEFSSQVKFVFWFMEMK